MSIIGVIPARMASTRFPGKPMAKILGMPMIGHVYLRTRQCTDLDEVYVTTNDREIADYIKSIGGKVIPTSSKHPSAADRTAEAVQKLEKKTGRKIDYVVMVQGNEPMISPQMIGLALSPLIMDAEVKVVNLMGELRNEAEVQDSNEIKVVVDIYNNALYFSREPIPSRRRGAFGLPMLKQVGVIPFDKKFLYKFAGFEQSSLEIAESIDMLRIVENGLKVKMVFTEKETYSVDIPDDLGYIEQLMEKDPLTKGYMKLVK